MIRPRSVANQLATGVAAGAEPPLPRPRSTGVAAVRGGYSRLVKFRLRSLLLPVSVVAMCWFAAGKRHRFAYWIGRTTTTELQALADDGYSLERLAVADDTTLVGLSRSPADPNARWVLFVPGNSTAILAGFRPILEQLRAGRDLGVCLFAYRGFDASDGAPNPTALRADLVAQWQWLRNRGVPPSRIEVWGYSLGSVLATQLVAEVSARGEHPARLVLMAAAPALTLRRHGPFGRLLPGDEYQAATSPGQCPVLVLHGDADLTLPITDARELATRFGSRATLHELPGRGHLDLWPEVARHLRD